MDTNTPEFSWRTRNETLQKLSPQSEVECLIIGGGIVGAGLARELAIRGIQTLLVEKSDFASGTSSKSSKLIHGGLRYLEMYDFRLVFEALSERHWLLKTHPHLVHPLQFSIPFYEKKNAPPAQRSSFVIDAGLWLYDALSLFHSPFFHGKHSKDKMLQVFPKLKSEGLSHGFYYADAMMLDDELVLETVYDAVKRGATCLNYTQALRVAAKDKNGFHEVYIQDQMGAPSPGMMEVKPIRILAKNVIVCVGPWTERIGAKIVEGSVKKLRPSKGVHFVVPWTRFPIESSLVMYAADKRIVFAIPRKDLGNGAEMVIIGTTDSPETRSPDEVFADHDDIEYLLRIVDNYFPDAKLTRSDIVSTYAGVRPLIDDGAESEAATSREHEIWRNPAGVVFMAGGKYTTFRKISQEIADFAFPRTHTSAFERASKEQLSTPESYAQRNSGEKVWGRFNSGWIEWKLKHHAPCNLSDIVFRRMPLWLQGVKVPAETLSQIAQIAAPFFGWDSKRVQKEIEETTSLLAKNFVK
ncbi:MAG: glycerol-3-phosphate dehydrogenase/oxidase [Bacteriovoracia bacterium]